MSTPAIPFTAALNALWLLDADFDAAARLLRVPVDVLQSMFQDADDVCTAYCERPVDWKPEHSLSTLAGESAGQGASFELGVQREGALTRIVGCVRRDGDGQLTEVVTLTHTDGDANWDTVLVERPGDIAPVARALACMTAAVQLSVDMMRDQAVRVNVPQLEITYPAG